MFATLEQFAAYVQRDLSAADAATAQMLLEAVTDEIRTYCGWHIAPVATETVTVDGSGSEVQGLPTLHLVDLVAVSEDGTDLTVADVQWSAAGYLRRPGYRWTTSLRGVVAEIEHGYAEVPAGLIALTCAVATRSWTNPAGVTREQSGGESVSYAAADGTAAVSALTDQEMRMLDRRWSIKGRP